MDLEEQLRKRVKDTGAVNSTYGGFEIRVSKPTQFPWYKIFNQLFDNGQEVWVNKMEGKIYINSKPRVP
jgi:hypothetical protein